MSVRRRTVLLTASAVAALTLVTACDSGGTAPGAAPAASAPAASAPAAGSSAAAAGATALRTAAAAGLGTVVTDGAGYTLYRFDQDTAAPPASHCDGACATLWPPVPAAGDHPQLDGVDASLVSSVTRADGTRQLTLKGWPLYRYAPDTRPGDTKGQGVKGTWWAVTPSGAKAAAASGTPATGGYGY
ncbi:hypothetical protein KNE206_33200 [Kitasatospora sp. NE20-6]|uniref:hypothetical protein n=1 Tax=Kitasatospora sp. NE20-6 TaxID=2859066 RepID=UPI0034DC46CA